MKTVLFTQRVELVESYNERRDCADQRIADFILSCGFLPVPVPNRTGIAAKMIDEMNPAGIILTGGNSLVKYGGNAPERDETDVALIESAIKKNIPLYGFCRGMQSILDYFECDLVNVKNHVATRHLVKGTNNTLEVNSYHNQGCLEIASQEIDILMQSEDGVIEKIRHKVRPIMATMWHPEREARYNDYDVRSVIELFGGDSDVNL